MKIIPHKQNVLQKALRAVFPYRCPYCLAVIKENELNCQNCEKKKTDIIYYKPAKGNFPCISAMPYVGVFANGIKIFKFHGKRQLAYQLAFPIAQAIVKSYTENDFDVITYVPLHKESLRKRGYNQSELLAKEIGKSLNIPVCELLKKTRKNQPQHKLKLEQRAKNVQGVYKVYDPKKINGKKILLIDDIITTGYTLGECAKTLQESDALSVHCATFAVAVAKTT